VATSRAPGGTAPRTPPPAPARTPDPARGPALLTLGVSLAACVVAVVIGGAAVPVVEGLSDVGPVVRWGLPLLRVVQDLSAALTLGLLLVGAWLLPGRGRPGLMLRAARYAVATGVVWVVATVVGVVLGFADAAGTPLGDPQLWSQLLTFVWSLETLRVAIISAVLAAAATTVAAVSLSRRGLATAAVLAVGALLPLALAGHAAGTNDHETAVNTLAVHVIGASVWVGGLLALVLLRPALGSVLPTVVARYSTLALWCYVAVAISGVVSAVVRLGGTAALGRLATAYGALVLVKTACLLVLGFMGWQQRRLVVARLADGTGRASRLFARFAGVELLVMGVAVGFATALARTAPPGLYLAWVLRLRRRGDQWSPLRTVSWVAGWVVLVWATCGAPGVLGRVSFSWHMIEHMTIAMYAPTLLVVAAPVSLALRALPARTDGSLGPRELLLGVVHSRPMRVVGNPVVASVLFFTSLVVFYYSPLFELALSTHTGHVLMVAHFLVTGYLFAWVMVGRDPGPPKWAPSLRLLILLITVSFHAFFGVSLMSGTTLLAPGFFEQIGVSWIPDPLADQQRGGAIAWALGEAPVLLIAMFVVRDWVRTDAIESRRRDRQAERDGGAELTAYNERLQALARRGERQDS
jgi:cytochrome c oxidase assembly factor CtaG/putative copper export protein